MLASETLSYEQRFLQFEQSRGRISVLQVSHPDGQPFHLNVYSPGHHSFYYAERFPKERIVLHFTAGFLQGDVPWLTRSNKYVSVPFVVGRTGEIFNLYRSAYWSYHLGVGDRRWDRASIGIELSNIGPLVLEGNMLKYEVQRQLPDGQLVTVRYDYCDVNESAYYQRIPQRYRGHEFFAAFTDAQYSSLARLLVYLTNRYNIPRVFLPPATRFDALPQNFSHRGILSHVNYRPSGKWDIGPAFDWARLEAAVSQQVILEP
ncbi:MAG: N-acetylmuramoyl-L-alanine amidase [Saprospiraceae bacterium]|nr:N-acetylmuramoyl-L-alanine amidase [Saprospiraceae bacterium]